MKTKVSVHCPAVGLFLIFAILFTTLALVSCEGEKVHRMQEETVPAESTSAAEPVDSTITLAVSQTFDVSFWSDDVNFSYLGMPSDSVFAVTLFKIGSSNSCCPIYYAAKTDTLKLYYTYNREKFNSFKVISVDRCNLKILKINP